MTASNYYLSNKQMLEKIAIYLIKKAEGILSSKDNMPYGFFADPVDYRFRAQDSHKIRGNQRDSTSRVLRKYFIEDKEITLSSQQDECLKLLVTGLTVKEIALQLRLSHRTVESHLNAVKSKMNTSYKSDVIKYYFMNTNM